MEEQYITLTKDNIANEHICCAFSDKKCKEGYELKKEWLSQHGFETVEKLPSGFSLLASRFDQVAPSPATIFSLFHQGKFITNDLSVCTESKFKKVLMV